MDYLSLTKLIVSLPWLVYLSVRDYRTHELPNAWVFGGMLVGCALAFGAGVSYGLWSLLTGVLCSLFLLLPFFLRASGAGDVKMLFAAGVVAGPGQTLNLVLLVSVTGFVLAVCMLLFRRVDSRRLRHYLRCLFDFKYDRQAGRAGLPARDTEACRVPFGIAIGCGLFLNLLMQVLFSLESVQ